jgi:hypothetical protein
VDPQLTRNKRGLEDADPGSKEKVQKQHHHSTTTTTTITTNENSELDGSDEESDQDEGEDEEDDGEDASDESMFKTTVCEPFNNDTGKQSFLENPEQLLTIFRLLRRPEALDDNCVLSMVRAAIKDLKQLPRQEFTADLFHSYEARWCKGNLHGDDRLFLKHVFWTIILQQYMAISEIPPPDPSVLVGTNVETDPADKPEYLLEYIRVMQALVDLKVKAEGNKAVFVAVCGCLEGSGKFYVINSNIHRIKRRIDKFHEMTNTAPKKRRRRIQEEENIEVELTDEPANVQNKSNNNSNPVKGIESSLEKCMEHLNKIQAKSANNLALEQLFEENPHLIQSVEVIKLCLSQLEATLKDT